MRISSVTVRCTDNAVDFAHLALGALGTLHCDHTAVGAIVIVMQTERPPLLRPVPSVHRGAFTTSLPPILLELWVWKRSAASIRASREWTRREDASGHSLATRAANAEPTLCALQTANEDSNVATRVGTDVAWLWSRSGAGNWCGKAECGEA